MKVEGGLSLREGGKVRRLVLEKERLEKSSLGVRSGHRDRYECGPTQESKSE